MERRRLNLMDEADRAFGQPHRGHGPEQQELPLPTPRRHINIDLSPVAEVKLRVSKETAAALQANPEGAASFIAGEAKRMYDELVTPWSRERPPCSGYWELRQGKALYPDSTNWWYSAPLNKWHRGEPQKISMLARFVEHGALMQGYEWRGLRQPFPGSYPYVLERAAFAHAPELGNTASETQKREGTFTTTPLPDLNPHTPVRVPQAAGTTRRHVEV